LGFSAKIRSSKNQVHHRGTEGTEREVYSFVYREMPIDEKNLSNQNNETLFFMDLLAQIDDQQRYSFIMLSM